jgi:Kef-type K+ transport system membrane component KefB
VAAEALTAGLLLEQGVIVLGAALGFVTLYRRLGVGAVLAYLSAGVLLGPHVTNVVPDGRDVRHRRHRHRFVAVPGRHGAAPSRLWRLKRDIFGIGISQVLACGAALTLLAVLARDISLAGGDRDRHAAGLSSTAQVLPFLRSTARSTRAPASGLSPCCCCRIWRSCRC